MPDQVAGGLVEDEQLAPARGDGEVLASDQGVEDVGVQSAGVHEEAGPERPAPGDEPVVRRARTHLLHPAVQVQVHSGADGLGGVREDGRPRADDRLARHVERGERAGTQVGLARGQCGGVDDPGAVMAVASGLLGEAGSAASCPSSRATSRAPSGSTGMPASRAYAVSSRCPRGRAAPPGCRARRRNRCAESPCWPSRCRRPRRSRPPRGRSAAGDGRARGRSRSRRPRLRRPRRRTRHPRRRGGAPTG